MRWNNLIVLGAVVAIFLFARTCTDRLREKIFDTEIVRAGEEYLGQWSGRTADAFYHIRLKRDGSFSGRRVQNGQTDTTSTNGKYKIVEEGEAAFYPRLLAIATGGDTLLNHYLASITPCGSTVTKVDRMVLKANSRYDTVSFLFYRVSPEDLERVQAEDMSDAPPPPTKDALPARELMALSACTDLPCVQRFMKDYATDFLHASKGEFAARHRSVVIDTLGNELIMPLSTIYIDVNPQAHWRLAHTLHRAELHLQLMEEFKQMGFSLIDSGYYRGQPVKRARLKSDLYPGWVLYIGATHQPWNLKGLYRNVTWKCYVFEMYREN
jgi:hypothetical protein